MTRMTAPIVPIRCPECNRWLSETNGYGRSVCARCGWEITVRSKAERQLKERTPTTTT